MKGGILWTRLWTFWLHARRKFH